MRISHRHKFVFFSNPKTGSSSIRKLLDPYSDLAGVPYQQTDAEMPFFSHMRPEEARLAFEGKGWDFDEYFRFTFVRNPWARLVSLYQMICDHAGRHGRIQRMADRAREFLMAEPATATPRGFRRWIFGISPDGGGGGGKPHEYWRRYGTYSIHAFTTDVYGQCLVDEVVRLEDLPGVLPDLLSRMGLDGTLARNMPHANSRRYRPYVEWYDPATRDHVGRLYATDIERFGYSFDVASGWRQAAS